jgi:tRNA(fMet)-specific endonuclease VapC
LQTVLELPFDQAAARMAGGIRGLLESRGEMIGPYDVLLAAQALAANLTLVTANVQEFQRVPGLSLENWTLDAK